MSSFTDTEHDLELNDRQYMLSYHPQPGLPMNRYAKGWIRCVVPDFNELIQLLHMNPIAPGVFNK